MEKRGICLTSWIYIQSLSLLFLLSPGQSVWRCSLREHMLPTRISGAEHISSGMCARVERRQQLGRLTASMFYITMPWIHPCSTTPEITALLTFCAQGKPMGQVVKKEKKRKKTIYISIKAHLFSHNEIISPSTVHMLKTCHINTAQKTWFTVG